MRSTRGRWGAPSRLRAWSGRGFGRSSRRSAGRRSGFTPADAFLGVLEEDALGAELFADGVRPREVAPGAGRLPLGDEPLDFLFKFDLPSPEDVQVAVGVIEEGKHPRGNVIVFDEERRNAGEMTAGKEVVRESFSIPLASA